jgi:uncharacterized protein YjbI with pentapeptide repeats
MKTITETELKSILDQHKLWLAGKGGKRANLYLANLEGATLTGANLCYANLNGAFFYRANLSGANLSGADLTGANLRVTTLTDAILTGANLKDAILTGAILTGAILTGAILTGANLSGADLTGANLRVTTLTDAILTGANLRGANLYHADLEYADLGGANLRGANLRGANLRGANLEDANLTNTVLDEKKNGETKMNMENENGFILSSEEKDMVLEYRKKTAKDKKINEIKQTANALRDSFRAIEQVAGGGTYCLEVGLQTNTKLLQEVLSLFGTVNQKLQSSHSGDGQLQKHTLSFAMPSLD